MSKHIWKSEIFVLRANDLKDLCDKVQQLLGFLEANVQVCLKDLAYTLNITASIGTSILAVVAESATDLHTKLKNAYARLQDPNCRKIHDVNGIYYYETGLYKKGALAFLFPGEGAQYLSMLADLRPHFPLVDDFFSQFEKMGEEKGHGNKNHFAKKLRQVFSLPQNASDDEIAEAKAELKNLGTTMLSVMLADWAFYFLLTKLGLKPDATAGHSLGELVALGSAGCIETDRSTFFERVDATFVGLQKQEISGKVPESRLLAVGTGKSAVMELINKLPQSTKEALFIAMDNCPHQCVVVGPKDACQELEEKMQDAAILFERLPFSRPYHTKLFEPLLDEIHTLFEDATFSKGNTTVYSCSTARPFPSDPKEIKHLTISHWSQPVEFTKMIHNMYGDGIRLFVEVGPRGNLTSFVSDILHGKTKAALATNVQRRSGISQLQHVCAELIAHGTPMDLSEFYLHRAPKRLSLEKTTTRIVTTTNREKVLSSYFQVMEQFLALQNDCMQKFLEVKRNRQNSAVPPGEALPTAQKNELQERMPLIGDIVRYEPGKLLVMTRKMDLNEDLFATHHTVGGRTLSKVDPEQYGLPVVPGTFILEMMAEAASLLFPKKCVISLKNVRFMRWLAYEDVEPNVIQITARLNKVENGDEWVSIEISDFGKKENETDAPKLAFTGTCVLADSYPEAPKVHDFLMTDEKACSIPLEIMRQNLFHGPLFHGVLSCDKISKEGIESRVRVLSREALFRSQPDPHFHLDPVLADCSMHPFVSWHLEQPDQSGRILLPAEIASFDIFAPPQPVGTEILSRGRIIDSSSRHFTHEVEAIDPHNRLLFHLRGVKFWRFYVPFGDVNFHGPKDAYFLSKAWNQVSELSFIPNIHTSCMHLAPPNDLKQPGMRLVTSRITLSPDEIKEFQSMKGHSSRLDEWLFGRIAAKDAIRTAWWQHTGERLFPADIEITPDQNGKPIGRLRDKQRNERETLPEVSISHTDGIMMALAAFSPYVGIDIEKIKPRESSFEEIAFDEEERLLLDSFGQDRNETIARFWCAKEALAKALGRGLIEGTRSVKIHTIDPLKQTLTVSLGEKLALEFPHFQNERLIVHTHREKDLIVATTFCERQKTMVEA